MDVEKRIRTNLKKRTEVISDWIHKLVLPAVPKLTKRGPPGANSGSARGLFQGEMWRGRHNSGIKNSTISIGSRPPFEFRKLTNGEMTHEKRWGVVPSPYAPTYTQLFDNKADFIHNELNSACHQ
ncbi:hypothetical protein NQZ68_005120 [Dissostichus eleginoides]|nr:hypothetical protein NQZ68_005120 [Dissostichus eleginoides]